MGFPLPVITITLATVVLISTLAIHVKSDQIDDGVSADGEKSMMGPTSFAERRQRRQARRGPHRPGPPGGQLFGGLFGGGQQGQAFGQQQDDEGNGDISISVPNCVEEGMKLVQGQTSYFVKCIKNPTHGGFYRVIYLCPQGQQPTPGDTSMCIPPPDCSACGGVGAGAGGGGGGGGANDDLGFNGLV